jgi:hypothetical protein
VSKTAQSSIDVGLVMRLWNESFAAVEGMRPERAALQIMRDMAGLQIHFPESHVVEEWVLETQLMKSLGSDPSYVRANAFANLQGLDRRKVLSRFRQLAGRSMLAAVKERAAREATG